MVVKSSHGMWIVAVAISIATVPQDYDKPSVSYQVERSHVILLRICERMRA